ncbi:MAG TPA: hypothetical protein VGR19_01160 [Allosphingosinicella sp.]|nr:hypothetical protein [Allosphingosinicella sp.]
MPLKDHDQLVAELKEANAKLAESLKRCRAIVAECRGKLAASDRSRRSAFAWPESSEAPSSEADRRSEGERRSSQG